MNDYVIYKTDDEAEGEYRTLFFIGEVEADHSTGAILAAAHRWPGEGGGEWVAIRMDHINRAKVTIGHVATIE